MACERDSKQSSGKEHYWRDVIQRWQLSGQTVRAFCAEQRLTEPSFYAWRRVITQRDQQRDQPPASPRRTAGTPSPVRESNDQPDDRPVFVPLRVAPTPPPVTPPTSGWLELVVGAGRVVRVPAGFDAATLRHLLAVLEEASC